MSATRRLRNLAVLVNAIAFFTAVVLGTRIKLDILATHLTTFPNSHSDSAEILGEGPVGAIGSATSRGRSQARTGLTAATRQASQNWGSPYLAKLDVA